MQQPTVKTKARSQSQWDFMCVYVTCDAVMVLRNELFIQYSIILSNMALLSIANIVLPVESADFAFRKIEYLNKSGKCYAQTAN